jgi:hypothetical protein
MSDLHPELQLVWDQVKQAAAEPVKWADRAAQVYHDWGSKNRQAMSSATGGLSDKAFDLMNQIADTPGADMAFAPLMGLTAEKSAARLGTIMRDYLGAEKYTPEMAKGIKDISQGSTKVLSDQVLAPIRGPEADFQHTLDWAYHSNRKPQGAWQGDTFVPTGEYNISKPTVSVNPRRLGNTMDMAYGNSVPPGYIQSAIHYNNDYWPMLEHKFGHGHENMHWLAEYLSDEEYRQLFGIPKRVDLHNPHDPSLRNLMPDLNENLTKDWENLYQMHRAKGSDLFLPDALTQDRPYYWKTGDYPKQPPYRSLLRENLADYGGLGAVDWPMDAIMNNTMKDKSVLRPYLR